MQGLNQLGVGVWRLALTLKWRLPTLVESYAQLVQYNVFVAQYEKTYLRSALIDLEKEDVNVYLFLQKPLHQLYPIDSVFCEKLSLRLVDLPQVFQNREASAKGIGAYLEGIADVPKSQDKEHESMG